MATVRAQTQGRRPPAAHVLVDKGGDAEPSAKSLDFSDGLHSLGFEHALAEEHQQ